MDRPAGIVDLVPSPTHFPFTSRWLDASVGPVHFVDEGDGPALLMLHGNPDWSFLYRHLIRELSPTYRCVAVDYPGFGLSVHPDGYGFTAAEHAGVVAELVEHLDLRDVVVVGQDWGGPIGMDVASRMPDRVRGLVMGNTWCWPLDDPLMRVFSRIMSSPPVQWLILQHNLFVSPLMRFTLQRRIPAMAFAHYLDVVPTPRHRRGIAEFPKQLIDAEAWLRDLEQRVLEELRDTPVLLPFGTRDPALGRRAIRDRWLEMFPDATLVLLGSASHYIQEDAPEELAEAIRRRFPVV